MSGPGIGYRPEVGEVVRAFDPRTLGVVKVGRVESVGVGTRWAVVDFGLTGKAKVPLRDVLELDS